jgi:hypothetical protein
MAWVNEFTSTTPDGKRVQYDTNALAHHSHAERPDRVRVSGRVVHKGYASDHKGYALYQAYVQGTITPERD